jgi:glycosyltransferase involved in cell wall biosynthesis
MRILQISSSRTYGGGERHFVDLCRGLQESGHEVFAALRPTNLWQERLDFLPPENILHVSIRNSFGILSASRIASFARDKKIAIIHAHVARDYIPASIACTLSSAKFVLTRHVMFPLKPFNRFALKNLSKAIAVSAPVGVALAALFPREKVAVIPNGIALRETNEAERALQRAAFRSLHDIPPQAPLIGTVGELVQLKGQRDLVLAAAEVLKKQADSHFLIVGRDNSIDGGYRRELRRLARVLEIEDRFTWLEWVEDVSALLAALDVFVSPSHSESFGMAILEAMASGTPVIATDTDGARELLGAGVDRVPVGEPVRLAEAITALLADPDRARRQAEEGKKAAVERFSLDRMIAETERLYLGL